MFELLQESFWFGLVFVGLLGLAVGSFLNVVIYRLPKMMSLAWRQESTMFLTDQDDIGQEMMAKVNAVVAKDTPLTLSKPASSCPSCQKRIRWYENIPVVSWLVLRGKCSGCQHPIGIRYPFVELATAAASMLVFITFGATLTMLFALGLTWCLIALTGIDFDTQLLPDRITLPLAAAGLAANVINGGLFVSPTQAIWGYVIGFLCLWIVYKLFLLLTGKHGMGYGDFKLLAALGAWLGPTMLPLIVLLSSLFGAIIGFVLMRLNSGESKPFAFGPYIAIAGFVALIWGKDIVNWYLGIY